MLTDGPAAVVGGCPYAAGVHETPADLAALQDLLDASYAAAGSHLSSIHTPDRRLGAAAVAERLTGMSLLTLATVTADGRPLTGPVDGIFYRAAFHFSSSPDSARMRHIRTRPAVSATHLPGEHLAVTVHGTAASVPITGQFRQTLLDVYGPRFGVEEWERFLADAQAEYVRIDARRMYAFHLEEPEPA